MMRMTQTDAVPISTAPTLRGKRPEHPKAFSSSVHTVS